MSDKVKRPHRVSMEGMIWNANHVLDLAMRPGIQGIPKELFESSAGLCIMSTVSVGLIFSGAVGTGIFTARYKDGTWSYPVACGLTGVGFGTVAGIEAQDLIIFLPDPDAVRTFFSTGVKLSTKIDLTLGVGRTMQTAGQASTSGCTDILTVGYTKGLWAGLDIEGAIVAPRTRVNKHFYGEKVDPKDIIESNKVTFPEYKVTLWPDVQEKLMKLVEGGVQEESTEEDKEKVAAAADAANVAAEGFRESYKNEEIVDAQEAAAKGKSAPRPKRADPPGEKHQRIDSVHVAPTQIVTKSASVDAPNTDEAPNEEVLGEAPEAGASVEVTYEGAPSEAPKEESPSEEAPKEEAPKDEAPSEEAPKEEAPSEQASKE